MLDRICAHLHNYFTSPEDIHEGTFTIRDGTIELDFLLNNQYFRIVGSALNDGVYQYPAEALLDETFEGEIWAMKVPRAVVKIAEEIEAWNAKYAAAMASPLSSESVIGVYSYTKNAGTVNGGAGDAEAWQGVFKSALNEWRKLR